MTSNPTDWVGISAAGSSSYSVTAYAYTNGTMASDINLTGVPDGTYVARTHPSGNYALLAESAPFTVGGAGTPGTGSTMPGPVTWSELSSIGFHTCGVGADGSLWCWGDNTYGQIGDGTTTTRTVPTQIGAEVTWNKLSLNNWHSCATHTNNTL